jgi:hypothetical protein
VNHVTRWQFISASDLRFAGLTPAECSTFCEQFGSSGAMNRAIDSTAAEKCRVRGIHDGINMQGRNIAADDVDVHGIIVARRIGRSALRC